MIKRSVILACCLLASCTVLPERTAVNLYQLPPSSLSASDTGSPASGGLRLTRPASNDAIGGRRLLVMAGDNSFQAYPDARWVAPIPSLWRDWLLDAFWRDGRIDNLSTDAELLRAELELGGVLRGLHTEYADGRSRVVIRYDARLTDVESRAILASRRFETSQAVDGPEDPARAVAALGEAADRMAAQLLDWLMEQPSVRSREAAP